MVASIGSIGGVGPPATYTAVPVSKSRSELAPFRMASEERQLAEGGTNFVRREARFWGGLFEWLQNHFTRDAMIAAAFLVPIAATRVGGKPLVELPTTGPRNREIIHT